MNSIATLGYSSFIYKNYIIYGYWNNFGMFHPISARELEKRGKDNEKYNANK